MTRPDPDPTSATDDGLPDHLIRWIDGRGWTRWLTMAVEPDTPEVDLAIEPPEEAGTVLLDVVSVVDHMRKGVRPGFTIWVAFEEALRWWIEDLQTLADGAPEPDGDLDQEDPDPLRTVITLLVELLDDADDLTAGEALQQALRRWVSAMSDHYNKGHPWPPPLPRY